MTENQATIILKNGRSYKTPMSNLENVKRLVRHDKIIFQEEEENEVEETQTKKRGRSKQQTN